MAFKALVYDLVHPLLGAVARNRWLINRLFDIRVPKPVVVHFDPTTLLMRYALQQSIRSADKTALEIGIGQGALLALGLQKSTGMSVQGVDCSQTRVLSSQQVATYNQLDVLLYTSDLFQRVPSDQRFDLIFFNPPYVPTDQGQRLRLTRRMRAESDCVWDGGQDGTRTLRAFLGQAPRFLTPRGRVLFGVQPIFVPEACVEKVIADTNWLILDRVKRRRIPSVVYVVGKE